MACARSTGLRSVKSHVPSTSCLHQQIDTACHILGTRRRQGMQAGIMPSAYILSSRM